MRPNHLALIPDGNRRWARKRGLPIVEGHKRGAKVVTRCLRWCLDEGIDQVSIYSLSTENFAKRSKTELRQIFKLLADGMERLSKEERIHRYEVRVNVLGHLYKLPDFLFEAAQKLMKATKPYARRFLNLLVAYGGQDEMLRAIELASKSRVGRLTKRLFNRYLWISTPVDLVIRTGGEHRLSNFLLYQSAYAEIVFVDKYWPDFTRRDFNRCLTEFERSRRRMGGDLPESV